jgi:hypothetical protein
MCESLAMAPLKPSIPELDLNSILPPYGGEWMKKQKLPGKKAVGFDSAVALGNEIDLAFANALAEFLGGISVMEASQSKQPGVALHPPSADCVEIKDVTIAGGARTQRFDVAYRPDGARIAFDGKTLNSEESWIKNWNNMINDLVAEATTVHHRYPDCVVAFLVLAPEPVLAKGSRLEDASKAIARIGGRDQPRVDNLHLAEAISLAIWSPKTGVVSPTEPGSGVYPMLRIEHFMQRVADSYTSRFGFAPPH